MYVNVTADSNQQGNLGINTITCSSIYFKISITRTYLQKHGCYYPEHIA